MNSSINISIASETPPTGIQYQSRFLLTARPLNIGTPSSACCASDAAVHVTSSCTDAAVLGPCCKQNHSHDSDSKKKKKKSIYLHFFSLLRYFQSPGLAHGEERDGTALLLSWKWMDGSRQKLIKLALARDMNCGITPWITSNSISLAQLVTRNRDESFSLQWNTSWTYRQKSIHQTLRFLLKFY